MLGKFKKDTRLMVINDEAHHCYLPKSKGKKAEDDGTNSQDENQKASIWYNGLVELKNISNCNKYMT